MEVCDAVRAGRAQGSVSPKAERVRLLSADCLAGSTPLFQLVTAAKESEGSSGDFARIDWL